MCGSGGASLPPQACPDLDIIPTTFILPNDFSLFVEEYKKSPSLMWIMKPTSKSKGIGIFIINRRAVPLPGGPCALSCPLGGTGTLLAGAARQAVADQEVGSGATAAGRDAQGELRHLEAPPPQPARPG